MLNNEKGSLMVIAVVILMLLTVIGISMTNTTSIELQIAGNDRLSKRAFYAADAGTELGIELLEQNIDAGGFASTTSVPPLIVYTTNFYINSQTGAKDDPANIPTSANRDVLIPGVSGNNVYLRVYNNTALSPGSAIQIAAGYEGKGKGLAGGGGFSVYDIRALAEGPNNSRSRVLLRWRHLF
jgi:Tfp pilus assembly protein PilX